MKTSLIFEYLPGDKMPKEYKPGERVFFVPMWASHRDDPLVGIVSRISDDSKVYVRIMEGDFQAKDIRPYGFDVMDRWFKLIESAQESEHYDTRSEQENYVIACAEKLEQEANLARVPYVKMPSSIEAKQTPVKALLRTFETVDLKQL